MKNLTIWALVLASVLSACSQTDAGVNPAGTAAAPEVATPAPPAPAAPVFQAGPLPTAPVDLSRFAGLTVEQLNQRHGRAITAGHVFSPAGDNVVEIELALRHLLGEAEGKRYQSLLNDVSPSLMLMAEGAIAQGNLAERDRLVNLMEAIDPTLPSLARLRETTALSLNAPLAAAAPPALAPDAGTVAADPQAPPVSR